MTPILLAIFIVMGLLALLSERSRVRSSAPQQKEVREPRVLALNAGDILRIRMKRDYYNSYTIARSADGSWAITDPSTEPASEEAVRRLLNTIETLPVLSTIDLPSDDSERHRQYGLWSPAMEVTVTTSKGDQTVVFGSKTPDSKGVYCAKVGESKVYVTSTESLQVFSQDLAALRQDKNSPQAANTR